MTNNTQIKGGKSEWVITLKSVDLLILSAAGVWTVTGVRELISSDMVKE